ncbi:MAG: hypothetical protein EO766_12085 [Hydrotalea sp. AMD]|uniref:hypothetical protein n=1 Tax=Hydrotalea sp. AMD TaxID=2501297 RepID=UPI0010250272|nr:hypothetical protein [Hydrotalea sp. AMD]RWZ87257.1 MAG: hypothetical protein EO766_12085 [Hydrotalea sp. AMD]
MAQFTWSETFISLEGEGVSPISLQGHPTVYVRFSRCNFTCQKFNNPNNIPITNDVLGFDPIMYKNIKELPVIAMGCDSLYAHDKRFEHLWITGDENKLALELTKLLPHMKNIDSFNYSEVDRRQLLDINKWVHPVTGLKYILSLTGGEPTLHQKTIPTLLNHPFLNDLKILLIETNGAVPLRDAFIDELNNWISKDEERMIIWSNSPKLSASGEEWSKAIQPEIITKQQQVTNYRQYFKFVAGPRTEDFDEIERAMTEYSSAIGGNNIVGIMPMACTDVQQNIIAKQLAQMCIERGYMYVARLQNYIWNNEVGT